MTEFYLGMVIGILVGIICVNGWLNYKEQQASEVLKIVNEQGKVLDTFPSRNAYTTKHKSNIPNKYVNDGKYHHNKFYGCKVMFKERRR